MRLDSRFHGNDKDVKVGVGAKIRDNINFMLNKKAMLNSKHAFTLIEILIVVAIMAILLSAIIIAIGQSRKNARINSAKTSVKSVLTAIVACNDGRGLVTIPPIGGNDICNPSSAGLTGSKWPTLSYGYAYVPGGNYTVDCNFQISTNGDTTSPLVCSCISQGCN